MKILLPFISSVLLSLGFVPLVRILSFRIGRVKTPRYDRWHKQPTPTLGGMAIFLSFALVISGFLLSKPVLRIEQWIILAGALMMFILGLLDDLNPLSPVIKLGGQLLAATVVIFFGNLTIRFFPWPIANILLTYFWLIGISNAINLLDNMDGLAAGITFITSLILAFFTLKAQDIFLAWLMLSLGGAVLGFLFFNYPPARIFMGDSGSLFLGFTLAVTAVARKTQASNVLAVLGVPVLIFLLPILDTSLVTITRLLRGQSPAQGGTDHTSHRLVSFGLNEHQVLWILYSVAIIGGVSAAALEALDYDISLGLIPLILVILTLFTAYLGQLKVQSAVTEQSSYVSRWIMDLTYRRRIFEILLDLVLVSSSYYLAYWTRNGLDMSREGMALFMQSWPLALVCAYLAFYLMGIYRGLWRYFGLYDLVRFFIASILCGALSWIFMSLIIPSQKFPLEIMALFSIFLFLSLTGSRASFSILDRLYNRYRNHQGQPGVIIVGAGDLGEILVRWLLRGSGLGFRPLGFVDDDETLWGRTIHGISILGGTNQIDRFIDELHPSGILLTESDNKSLDHLIKICREKAIWLKKMQIDFETLEEGVGM